MHITSIIRAKPARIRYLRNNESCCLLSSSFDDSSAVFSALSGSEAGVVASPVDDVTSGLTRDWDG